MALSGPASLPSQQLSRTGLLYVLSAFAACVLSMALFLPWWLLPVAGACAGWRLLVFSGRCSFPPVLARGALVLLAVAALLTQYGLRVSLDLFVMLLLLGFSLKLLELHRQPDAQRLLYLAFFVLMTLLLFEQSPRYALLALLDGVLVTAAMVAIHGDERLQQDRRWQPLRQSLLLVLLSLPVMLFLFVVMPRIPPLWSMPLQKQQAARTGMSDSMSPGEVASLARSSELAFRVTFPQGSVPPRRELYWRGIVLDRFDGIRWTESCKDCRGQWRRSDRIAATGDARASVPYQVILEPSGQRWAYVLAPAMVRDQLLWVSSEGTYRFTLPVTQRQSYEARWLPDASHTDMPVNRDDLLWLPSTGNPQARALGQAWAAGGASAKEVIAKALALFNQSFSYTLQPPLTGEQRIDGFLFGTRSGFCEHFAGSFVFLMRAAGVPARVVMGYHGGELHETEGYVAVRQYDAHAWAEVWLDGEGWVRVDPTSAVAPERVDLGFAGAFSGNEAFPEAMGWGGLAGIRWLEQLSLQLEYMDYLWARWVLAFEGEQQSQLLARLGLLSPYRIALWAGGGVLGVFLLLCVYLYWREWWIAHEPASTRRYRQLCHAYAQWGVERLPAETPLHYAARVRQAGLPGAAMFDELSRDYYRWRFLPEGSGKAEPSPGFRRQSLALSWRLFWSRITVRGNG